ELAEQVAAGELPEPREIFVAVGSGGTLAGLALGLRLAGLGSRLVGVLVTDIVPPRPATLARAARRSLSLLRRADPTLPEVQVPESAFSLARDRLGAGYGATTPEAEAAVARAAQVGITLETTYTGKCLAEILEREGRGSLAEGPILFWNTHNAVDVSRTAPYPASVERLPRSIARLLAVDAEAPVASGPAR
ncbi:MAG: pyridoxal-phosphate dependent enzyme, partial [Myxococcota bacterium]